MKALIKIILAVATLTGTIIGVGIFSLPYIASRAGLGLMILYLIALTAIVLIINLMFSEVALKTPDFLRLPGCAKTHLGKWGKIIASVSMIIGSVGTLLAYIIVGGGFLAGLLGSVFGASSMLYVLIYFIIGAMYIYMGSKAIAKLEFWGMGIFFVALIVLLFQSGTSWNFSNLVFGLGESAVWFLPYGPILFALWGATMVPEIEEMLGADKKKLKLVITISTIISSFCYLCFILLVLGISGANTTQEAIVGLQNALGPRVISILFLAGLLATFTSFVVVGLNLKKVLWYDMKLSSNIAWGLTCFVPFMLFLAGLKNFIGVIGFVGGISMAMEGVLIILMYRKVEYAKSKLLMYPLILIFALGLIYEIIHLF